jgi:hypothetical protein
MYMMYVFMFIVPHAQLVVSCKLVWYFVFEDSKINLWSSLV